MAGRVNEVASERGQERVLVGHPEEAECADHHVQVDRVDPPPEHAVGGVGSLVGPLIDQAAVRAFERAIGAAQADQSDPPVPLRRRTHGTGVLNGVGRGLLHRDVLPRLERRDHVVMVEMGGGEHLNGIERGIAQHVVEVAVKGGRAPVLRRLSSHDLVGVAHRSNLATRVEQIALHVEGRDVPGPEHTQSDLVHSVSLSSLALSSVPAARTVWARTGSPAPLSW